MKQKVYILAVIDGNDIAFRAVSVVDFLHERPWMTPMMKLEGKAAFYGGNPNSLYGEAARKVAASDDFEIVVFEAVSGQFV